MPRELTILAVIGSMNRIRRTTPLPPLSARVAANRKFFHADGISQLENFWICHAGVRHVAVNGRAAIEAGSCASAATDSFIVI